MTSRDMEKLLYKNDFEYSRYSGSHKIYKRESDGALVSVPKKLNKMIAKRLVKEFSLL